MVRWGFLALGRPVASWKPLGSWHPTYWFSSRLRGVLISDTDGREKG